MTLPADLQRAVDAGDLVFPVDVDGRGSIREVRIKPGTNQPCPGSQGSSAPIWWEQRDGVDFNKPRQRDGATYRHGAVDIFGGVGTYCYAIEAGRVELLPSANAGPHGLRVRGRFGVWLYSHMSDRDVDDGDVVEAGELVGRLGAEGNVHGCPHLHFGWRGPRASGNGGPQKDPAELLRALRSRTREPRDPEGPTVDGENDERDRALLVLSEQTARAEALLLDVADQWEETGDRNAAHVAAQLRDVVRNARATYWRIDPARTLDMLRGTHSDALRIWQQHPEWFEDASILNGIRRALDAAKEALAAAAASVAAGSMAFGVGGLLIVALIAFGSFGGPGGRR